MIYVIAEIETVPGKQDEHLAAFHELMPLVHAEQGCLEYGPATDVATPIEIQEPLRENVVTVIEKWESIAALEAHLQAPHMDAYREQVKDMVAGIRLQVLEPA